MSVLLPVWVRTRLHAATGLGLLGGLLGGGLLVGVLLGRWVTPRLPRRATLAGAFLLCSSPPFFALAGSSTLPLTAAVFVVSGILGGVLNPIIGGFQYSRVPEAMQARVFGTTKATAWAGIPLGSVLGGVLASTAGLTAALTICGVVMFAATLPPSLFPVWRGLDRSAPATMVPV
jgi:predicted MFS family arabinose efflux permease